MVGRNKLLNKHQIGVIIVVVLAVIIGTVIVLKGGAGSNVAGEAFKSPLKSSGLKTVQSPGQNYFQTCAEGIDSRGSYAEDANGRRYDNSCDGNYLVKDYQCKGGSVSVNSRHLCQNACSNGRCSHDVFVQWSESQGSAVITFDGIRYGPFNLTPLGRGPIPLQGQGGEIGISNIERWGS